MRDDRVKVYSFTEENTNSTLSNKNKALNVAYTGCRKKYKGRK